MLIYDVGLRMNHWTLSLNTKKEVTFVRYYGRERELNVLLGSPQGAVLVEFHD